MSSLTPIVFFSFIITVPVDIFFEGYTSSSTDPSMSDFESSPKVVHRCIEEVKHLQNGDGGSTLTLIPAYHLYKVAREEELLSYRSVCRVLAMHYGSVENESFSRSSTPQDDNVEKEDGTPYSSSFALQKHCCLPKAAKRLLEDLRELWCITDERAKVEQMTVMRDDVVKAVYHSHVLQRRENFFDGVDDIELPTETMEKNGNGLATGATEDDGYGLYMATKRARTDTAGSTTTGPLRWADSADDRGGNGSHEVNAMSPVGGGSSSNVGSVRGGGRRKGGAQLAAQLARLRREVKGAAQNYIYSTDPITLQEATRCLDVKREELLALREELLE